MIKEIPVVTPRPARGRRVPTLRVPRPGPRAPRPGLRTALIVTTRHIS